MKKKIFTIIFILIFLFSIINAGAVTFSNFKSIKSAAIKKSLESKDVDSVVKESEANTKESTKPSKFVSPAESSDITKRFDFRRSPGRSLKPSPSEAPPEDEPEEEEASNIDTSLASNTFAVNNAYFNGQIAAMVDNDGIGVLSQALNSDACIDPTPDSTSPHFACILISEPRLIGQEFTITATAADSDDDIVALTLGEAPYTAESDWQPQNCVPAESSCTKTWTLSEDEVGTYTYRIKAKNARDQIVTTAVDVTVNEQETASMFKLRTAAVDGATFDNEGVIEYIDNVLITVGTDVDPASDTGMPFATFNVPSGQLLIVSYEADGYLSDTDYLYFEPYLQNCAGSSCSYSSNGYSTSCEYVPSYNHYYCYLENPDYDYNVHFTYRPHGDPLGDNVVRYLNYLYSPQAPIVEFGDLLMVSFAEGSSYSLDLDDYVFDPDTDYADLVWTVSSADFVNVDINPSSHVATITQINEDWIGRDIIRFTATDPEGNSDSDLLTVDVVPSDNDPPIVLKNPDVDRVELFAGQSQTFSIRVFDPDYDYLTITWELDSSIVAQNVFSYTLDTTEAASHVLEATVSDGVHDVPVSWAIEVLPPEDNAPSVMNVQANPPEQEQFGVVDISAFVTDDTEVDEVMVRITYPDSTSDDFPMSSSGSLYSYNFTNTMQAGDYSARIIATDIFNNVNNTETVGFTILPDTENPTVLNVNAEPDQQNQSEPVTISADVTDNIGLRTVQPVQARITYPDSSVQTFGMVNVVGSTYSFDFSDTNQTGTYTATIIATDIAGNINDTESVSFVINPTGLVLVTTDLATAKSLISGDTYTDSGTPDLARGGGDYLRVRANPTARVYIEFDLTSLPIINFESVQLNLYRYDSSATSRTYEFYYCDDTFGEGSLTWNNQDTEVLNCDGVPFLTMSQLDITNDAYNAFDLTSLLQTKNDKDTFTIKIKDQVEDSSGALLQFWSKENGADEPFLNVSYYTNP